MPEKMLPVGNVAVAGSFHAVFWHYLIVLSTNLYVLYGTLL